jgi:hypothetical protein
MASQTDRPMEGERYTAKDPSDYPALPSGLVPLPYFPILCRALGGVTISIVLCYLEIHHSAPEPDLQAPARLRNPPIYLDCDRACFDLGVSRRTLDIALMCLGTWWKEETQRSAAARAGREFLCPSPSFHVRNNARIKPYAIVGSRQYADRRTLAIHRNYPRLAQIFVNAGITTLNQTPQPASLHCVTNDGTCASTSVTLSLSEVLESACGIAPAKHGIAWGWSPERKMAHSRRMAELWAERRKSPKK